MADIVTILEFDKASLDQLEGIAKDLKIALGKDVSEEGIRKTVMRLQEMLETQKKITKEQQEQGEKTESLYQAYTRLRKEYKNATDPELAKKLKVEFEKVRKEVQEFEKVGRTSANTWGNALSSFQFKFNALGNAVAAFAGTAMNFLKTRLKETTSIIVNFDYKMRELRAVLGEGADAMKKLSLIAQDLGSKYSFTAEKVADLMTEYAKLGFTSNEIVGMAEATTLLAIATGEDLKKATEVTGATLRQFGLDAIETQRVVDIMSTSFNRSALDLDRFNEAMKYVGPVASKAGFSLEDTAAILSVLSNNGLYGSLAGNQLKNILLRLADSSSDLSKKLGGTVSDLSGMTDAFEKLKATGADLTQIFKLVDLRAVVALSTLVNKTDDLNTMGDAMHRVYNATQLMANVRLDTVKGQLDSLKAAWQSLVLAIEDGNGVLAKFIKEALAWGAEKLRDLRLAALNAKEALSGAGLEEANKRWKKWVEDRADDAESLRDTYEKQGLSQKEIQEKIANEMIKAATEKYEIDKKKQTEINAELLKLQKDYEGQRADVQERYDSAIEVARTKMNKARLELYKISLNETRKAELKQINIAEDTNTSLLIMQKGYYDQTISNLESFINSYNLKLEELNAPAATEEVSAAEIERIKRENERKVQLFKQNFESYQDMELAKYAVTEESESEITQYEINQLIIRLQVYKKFGFLTIEEANRINEELYKLAKKRNEQISKEEENEIKKKEDVLRENERMNNEIIKDIEQQAELEILKYKEGTNNKYKILKEEERILKEELDKLKSFGKEATDEIIAIRNRILQIQSELGDIGVIERLLYGMGVEDPREVLQKMQEATNQVLDVIREQLQFKKDAVDREISYIQNLIDEKEHELDRETEMRAAGLANAVETKQKELDDLKAKREEALKHQEKIIRAQQKLEAINQSIAFATTIAELIKAITKKHGEAALIIAPLAGLAMYAIWDKLMSQIPSHVPKFAEGGEIEGRSHAQGGVLVEAEGGEYIVRKDRARQFSNVLDIVNNDPAGSIWKNLNSELDKNRDVAPIINLNTTKTEELLTKLVNITESSPKDYGSYIEVYHNGVKYRIKKS